MPLRLNSLGGKFSVAGHYTVFDVDERTGLWRPRFSRRNQIQYGWASIACQLFGLGKAEYKVNAMYVEFENVASAGDAVTVPDFERSEGIEYYTGLSGSRDYLRVPLLSTPLLAVGSGYDTVFDGEDVNFNQVTFLAQTSGATGVRGVTFASGSNSKVCGIALVATPVWADSSRDIVFSRAYYDTSEQVLKQASHQVGLSWTQVFG